MRYKKTAFLQLFILLSFSLSLYAQSADISGSTEVNKCETNQYTITINNNSGNPLTSIVVTNSMPVPGFSYVSGSCTLNSSAKLLMPQFYLAKQARAILWDKKNKSKLLLNSIFCLTYVGH